MPEGSSLTVFMTVYGSRQGRTGCPCGLQGAIPESLAKTLVGACGLRNVIAHGYGQLDAPRVHAEAQKGIPALREFVRLVMQEAKAG